MSILEHPKAGEIFACQKMRKKKQNQFLLSNVYNLRVFAHFATKTCYSSKYLRISSHFHTKT